MKRNRNTAVLEGCFGDAQRFGRHFIAVHFPIIEGFAEFVFGGYLHGVIGEVYAVDAGAFLGGEASDYELGTLGTDGIDPVFFTLQIQVEFQIIGGTVGSALCEIPDGLKVRCVLVLSDPGNIGFSE